MKTGWTTPWVIDARTIWINKGCDEFDTDDPRCVALRAFAVSLAPASSAGEIGDLPPGRTKGASLFWVDGLSDSLIPEDNIRSSDLTFLTSFCAFTFRPNDDDFTTRVDDEDSGLRNHSRRGGYAVRVADLREP